MHLKNVHEVLSLWPNSDPVPAFKADVRLFLSEQDRRHLFLGAYRSGVEIVNTGGQERKLLG